MRLSELSRNAAATVRAVEATRADDPIARRLAEIGFVPGETVRLVATGPLTGDPIVVQVGFTRFALRLAEAARVEVEEVAP